MKDFHIAGELWSAMVLAGSATIFAWLGARFGTGRRHFAWAPTLILCIPGLLGTLVLALAILWLFQTTALAALYDTPVPLLLVLTLLLLPFAVLLYWVLDVSEPGTALHLSGMLKHSSTRSLRRAGALLHWQMRGQMRWCVVWLLFLMAYFDVVAAAMLAPTHMTPASVRLYNQMHYGASGVLSAMVCVMVLTPLLLGVLVWSAGTLRNLLPWPSHV